MNQKAKCSQCNERNVVAKGLCNICYQRAYAAQRKGTKTTLVPTQPAAIAVQPAILEMPTVHLVARSPSEMQAAQLDVAMWLRGKLRSVSAEITDLSDAYQEAASNGWRTEPLGRQLNKADNEEKFYNKVLLAVEAGFVIVPEFPIDVFAIRVKRKHVTHDMAETGLSYHNPANDIEDQQTDLPTAGQGRYESPVAKMRAGSRKSDDGNGEQKLIRFAFTDDWGDIVFPLRAARPVVMNATAQAMALKIFDQIGICQPVRNARVTRKGDPLIIGQVLSQRQGWSQKCVSFIIAWHLNLNDL